VNHRPDDDEPPAPPNRRRSWTAEIEWREAGEGARFVVVAAPAGSGLTATIASSPQLTWPPTSSESVHALGEAAAALQVSLLDAGWTPLAPGRAWYAKRFAWEPAPEPVVSPPPNSPLFAPEPPWPEGAADRWRCEIGWNAGWSRSRFSALTYGPGARRGREVKASGRLRWLFMAEPDMSRDEHLHALETLAAALISGGWEPVGTGADWYARRFWWASDEAPDEPFDASPARTDVRDEPPHTYGEVVSQSEEDVERLLRSATPTPRPGYVQELERSLRLRPQPRASRRLRLALAGAGAAAALAVVAVVAAVVGVLPGSSGSPGGAQAQPNCRQVTVERWTRQAYFETDRDGKVHVRYRTVLAPRVVKRCR
jgi:hypothetical protein